VLARSGDVGELLRVAGALEAGSEHSIGRAIAKAAAAQGAEPAAPGVRNFRALPGLGAEGSVEGRHVLVGSPRLLRDSGILIPDETEAAIATLSRDGKTIVVVAIEREVAGVLGLTDTVKPSAGPAIAALRRLGLRTIMVTGDSAASAAAIGALLGVDEVIAGVLPAEKTAVILRLQADGKRVAMIGDGINDAAALASANLGMAVVSGTDIAMKSADIILVRDDLSVIVDAIRLSRKTLHTIRGNLVWAFGYNVLAIPIAAAGLLNPLVAAAAMALSSILVIGNSLRLRSFVGTAGAPSANGAPSDAAAPSAAGVPAPSGAVHSAENRQ
jgi:Cu+-exporting ATPase